MKRLLFCLFLVNSFAYCQTEGNSQAREVLQLATARSTPTATFQASGTLYRREGDEMKALSATLRVDADKSLVFLTSDNSITGFSGIKIRPTRAAKSVAQVTQSGRNDLLRAIVVPFLGFDSLDSKYSFNFGSTEACGQGTCTVVRVLSPAVSERETTEVTTLEVLINNESRTIHSIRESTTVGRHSNRADRIKFIFAEYSKVGDLLVPMEITAKIGGSVLWRLQLQNVSF